MKTLELGQALKNKRTGKIFTICHVYDYLDVTGEKDVWHKSYHITLVGGNWRKYWMSDDEIEKKFDLIDLSFDEWKSLWHTAQ